MLKIINSLLFCFNIVVPILGQEQLLTFDHLTVNDGLSQNTIFSIIQDNDGFIWFATEDGLNRYNSCEFKIYRTDPADTNTIINNFVNDLHQDKTGTIWIATRSGICSYSPLYDSFKRYPQFAASTELYVNTLFEDSNGNIWLATRQNGLIMFNPHNNSHREYSALDTLATSDTGRLTKDVRAFVQLDDSIYYAFTMRGLLKFNINRDRFEGENEMALIHSIFNTHPAAPSVLRNDIPEILIALCLSVFPKSQKRDINLRLKY